MKCCQANVYYLRGGLENRRGAGGARGWTGARWRRSSRNARPPSVRERMRKTHPLSAFNIPYRIAFNCNIFRQMEKEFGLRSSL
ncbi:unnamed protein product [Pieris brassicae]|uniref:Uncharacterized protein n=1 Tax=Pieris brassicae TaxID=7116 RepID=A0A9P0XJC4_PIEBR|nr:unnamed protein product [Pieris brassicae]